MLLFVVYAPSGKVTRATATIADYIHMLQQQHPDAPAIVAGDMDHCRLQIIMAGIDQFVKGHTRKATMFNKCFVNVEGGCVDYQRLTQIIMWFIFYHLINLNKPGVNQRKKIMFGLKAKKNLKHALIVPCWKSFIIAPWTK